MFSGYVGSLSPDYLPKARRQKIDALRDGGPIRFVSGAVPSHLGKYTEREALR